MNRKTQLRRFLFVSHRYMGLVSALFVILLSITGIMLNHTEALSLDEKRIQAPSLLSWYGIEPPEMGNSFQIAEQTLSHIEHQLFLNNHSLGIDVDQLVGAVSYQGMYIAAATDKILLLTPEGELIEQLTAVHGIPQHINRIGMDNSQQRPVIETANQQFQTDEALLSWEPSSLQDVVWSHPSQMDSQLKTELLNNYQGEGLDLERITLDLHSGRILGNWGIYLMDIMAVLFLLISSFGVWIWSWRKLQQQSRNKKTIDKSGISP